MTLKPKWTDPSGLKRNPFFYRHSLFFFLLFLELVYSVNSTSTSFCSDSLFNFIYIVFVAHVPVVVKKQSGFGGQGDWQIISRHAFFHSPIGTLAGIVSETACFWPPLTLLPWDIQAQLDEHL
ncbi:hypothetical protein XENOCAPTIV_031022 [Xenoophorus captivus]|uniref:Uncharacterized protein n=1 Tax=Xenoophorus captivus TaxID=1517983 RepID=A0ABV0RJV4_9TELE